MTQLGQIALIPGAEVDIREPDRDCYGTPWSFVDDVQRRFGMIELDVCCLEGTAKSARFYTPQDDGLSKPWNARLWWCNPPYSDIEPWVLKGIDELDHNPKSFMGAYLLPSGRAGQPWQRMLRQREARGAAVVIELAGPGRIGFVAPAGVKASSNMEESLLVLCWKPFVPMGVYR